MTMMKNEDDDGDERGREEGEVFIEEEREDEGFSARGGEQKSYGAVTVGAFKSGRIG